MKSQLGLVSFSANNRVLRQTTEGNQERICANNTTPHHTTPHHTTPHSNIQLQQHTLQRPRGRKPEGIIHRLRPSHFTTQGASLVIATQRNGSSSHHTLFTSTYLPSIDRNETRDRINFGIHFFSFLLNSHPGEDINDYDHHGDLLVGLGWAGSDRILVWFGGFGLSVLGE